MNSGSISSQSRSFRDCKAIFERAPVVFLDHQSRGAGAFEENSDTGKLVHGVLGWDKLAPESMAMYQVGRTSFRVASKPAPEARMWMVEGFAGGIQPWWHHIGAYHDDRRMYHTAEPLMKWFKENERYMVNRRPLATVGIAWSQRNTDFYGRDRAAELTDAPYRGFVEALVRARVPYIPLHIDHLDREAPGLKTLILPNIAAMSDAQCASVRKFAANGGSVIATGVTSLYTEMGDPRPDFGLADLFGTHASSPAGAERSAAGQSQHTYLRLLPEMRAGVYGPHTSDEPKVTGTRHAVLKGFSETDIIPFGGTLTNLKVDSDALVPLTFVPVFPIYPPETAWMRQPVTTIPGLVIKGKCAFMPADIDRRYKLEPLPDYADLLANLVNWATAGEIPLRLEGHGLFDCNLYTQPGRIIAHIVNLTVTGRTPVDELIPSGALKAAIHLPPGVKGRAVKALVGGKPLPAKVNAGWVTFEIPSVLDHEVLVIE